MRRRKRSGRVKLPDQSGLARPGVCAHTRRSSTRECLIVILRISIVERGHAMCRGWSIRPSPSALGLVLVVLIGSLAWSVVATRPEFVSDAMIASAAKYVGPCLNESGVSTEDIESVRNGDWPESEELKCYMYCLWEQFGLVDTYGELNLSGMLTFFQRMPAYRAEVQKAVKECKALSKYWTRGNSCEYAYSFNQCYASRSPTTYYLF